MKMFKYFNTYPDISKTYQKKPFLMRNVKIQFVIVLYGC